MLRHCNASPSKPLLCSRHVRGPLRVAILLGILLAAFCPFSRSAAAPTLLAPAGSMLYFTDTREIRRYDLNTGALVDVLVDPPSGESHSFLDMAFGPDGKLYVLDGFSEQVGRYDAQTGALLDVLISAHADGLIAAYHIAFGPDGNLYLSGQDAAALFSKVLRYDIATGALIDTFIPKVDGSQITVQEMVFGSDNNLYITALPISGTRAYVLKYDGSTGALITTLIPPETGSLQGFGWGLTFGPACSIYMLMGEGVQRYDAASGVYIGMVARVSYAGHGAQYMAFGLDGYLYVSIQSTNAVERYNSITGELIDTFVPPSQTNAWNNFIFYIPPSVPQSLAARAYLPMMRAC